MFGIFRKKTQVEKLLAADGMEHATDRFAQIVARKLTSRQIAYQFILEELHGASMGNSESQLFVKNSGIESVEYKGALNNSMPEVDGPDGPQQLLQGLSLDISDQNLMAEFRCKIDDKIMSNFRFGKYAPKENRLEDLYKSLRGVLMDDSSVVPALTPNMPAPEGAGIRHVHFRKKNLATAQEMISTLSQMTGNDTDFIICQALGNSQRTS